MVNVLVVEDEGLVGLNLQKQLVSAGYHVPVIAASAEEAIGSIEREAPDIVLMDVKILGARDGIETAEVIRQRSQIPIIFLSALSDKSTLQRAGKTLPAGYMVKPISLLSLISSIEVALSKKKTMDAGQGQPPIPPTDLRANGAGASPLKESPHVSQLFESLVKSVEDYAIFMLSPNGIVLSWNEGAQRIKGYSASEIIGKHFSCFYLHDDIQRGHPDNELKTALANGKFAEEGWRLRRDGSRFWASVTITPIWDQSGRHTGFSKVTHDITERKAAETALRNSERDFRLLADAIPHIVWMTHGDGRNLYHNRRWTEFAGFEKPAVPGEPANEDSWTSLLHPEETAGARGAWQNAVASQVPFEGEYRLWDAERQEYRWHLARALPVRNESGEIARWFGTLTDIHQRKAAEEELELEVRKRTAALSESLEQLQSKEESLRQSLAEKEVLLKEIHHRVKNNLQIISSLLSMQAANIEDDATGAKLRDSERRVMSMALIHEQLYGTKNMSFIDFSEYVAELVPRLLLSLSQDDAVRCRLDTQPTIVTIDRAIPCGLILNELVTNALKYAYPHGKGGEVVVTLRNHERSVMLKVSDHGIGFPVNFDAEKNKTLGLQIIRVLVKQIGGTLQIDNSPGATFTIHFPHEVVN